MGTPPENPPPPPDEDTKLILQKTSGFDVKGINTEHPEYLDSDDEESQATFRVLEPNKEGINIDWNALIPEEDAKVAPLRDTAPAGHSSHNFGLESSQQLSDPINQLESLNGFLGQLESPKLPLDEDATLVHWRDRSPAGGGSRSFESGSEVKKAHPETGRRGPSPLRSNIQRAWNSVGTAGGGRPRHSDTRPTSNGEGDGRRQSLHGGRQRSPYQPTGGGIRGRHSSGSGRGGSGDGDAGNGANAGVRSTHAFIRGGGGASGVGDASVGGSDGDMVGTGSGRADEESSTLQ